MNSPTIIIENKQQQQENEEQKQKQEQLRKQQQLVQQQLELNEFEPELLYEAFVSSLRKLKEDEDDVSMREYLVAYYEITKFLYSLGNLFYFVIVDLKKKLTIVEGYLETSPSQYETMLTMVKYEHKMGMLTKPDSLNKRNATRTILRLHRALIFICKLLEGIYYAEENLRTAQICTEAYELTLAKYHSWLARKAATFGMRALPKRDILISYMLRNNDDHQKFPIFIRTIERVYNITQRIYERYDILELP